MGAEHRAAGAAQHLMVALFLLRPSTVHAAPPSILFIVADDLGWQDLGFREVEPGVPTDLAGITPFIDELVAGGVTLDQLYVSPVCSPMRAQLMTGQYGLRMGFLDILTPISSPGHLPLDVRTLAEDIHDAGYATGCVGKWHVGFSDPRALPMSRGFESSYNYYAGSMNFFTKQGGPPGQRVFDIHANGLPDRTERHLDNDFYSGQLWQERAEQIIVEHAAAGDERPLFLYYAFQNPHGSFLQVPDEYLTAPCGPNRFPDPARRIYCGMIRFVEESVKTTHEMMRGLEQGDGLVMIFMADNGGSPTHGGYNMPLRGQKGTLFDGGVRSNSFVWSDQLPAAAVGSTYRGLLHVTDMLPTMLHVATDGSWSPEPVGRVLDGYDQWEAIISGGSVPSPRTTAVLSYWDAGRGAAARWNDAGREWKLVANAPANRAGWTPVPTEVGMTEGNHSHRLLMGGGGGGGQNGGANCSNSDRCWWLFDLAEDDDERINLHGAHLDVVAEMVAQLDAYADVEVTCEEAQTCGPVDPRALVAFAAAGYYVPWIDVP